MRDKFQRLYGCSRKDIKPHCIISPLNEAFLFTGLGIGAAYKGVLFRVTQTRHATVVSPRINLLAGDCVLGLKDSPCECIYLFGSCGGLPGLRLGDMAIVGKSYNFESFSDMLQGKITQKGVLSDTSMRNELSAFLSGRITNLLDCATVNSLLLEEKYAEIFKRKGISCVDMESSMVFLAARSIRRRAIALLYISDIIVKKPFYKNPAPRERQRVENSRRQLAGFLSKFILSHEARGIT